MRLEDLTFEYIIGPPEHFEDYSGDLPPFIEGDSESHLAHTIGPSLLTMLKEDDGPGKIFVVSALDQETMLAFIAGCINDSRAHVADVFSHFTRPVYAGEHIRGQGIMRQMYKKVFIPQMKQGDVRFVSTIVPQNDVPDSKATQAARVADIALRRLGYINARLNKKGTRIISPKDPSEYVLDLRKY